MPRTGLSALLDSPWDNAQRLIGAELSSPDLKSTVIIETAYCHRTAGLSGTDVVHTCVSFSCREPSGRSIIVYLCDQLEVLSVRS